MSFYLLCKPNHALCALTTAPELQIQNFNPRSKMVQNVNFLFISQNNDLNLKSTRQHVSRGILGFQNRASNIEILKFHINRDNSDYLKKCDFNISSFSNSEVTIGFMALNRKWYQILISSLSWRYMQNEINFNWQFSPFVSKNVTFCKRHQT